MKKSQVCQKWFSDYLRIPTYSVGQEGLGIVRCRLYTQNWFKCINMVKRILEDHDQVGLEGLLVITRSEQHSKWYKCAQVHEKQMHKNPHWVGAVGFGMIRYELHLNMVQKVSIFCQGSLRILIGRSWRISTFQ
jgi:hypothetical protein